MTCTTANCTEPATLICDNRGQVRRPTMSAPTHCLVHAAGQACTRLIRPSLNVLPTGFRVTDPGAHVRSAAGHKSQKGW